MTPRQRRNWRYLVGAMLAVLVLGVVLVTRDRPEPPQEPATRAELARVGAKNRAAANRAAQETRLRAGLEPSPELARNGT